MKNLKLLILAFGALGVVSLLMEFEMFKFLLLHPFEGGGAGLILIGGFVLPTVMGIMGMTKPPLQMWQAGAALAGFAAIAIKGHIWEGLPHIMDMNLAGKLSMIAVVGGIVVSGLALAKPESANA